MDLPWGRLGYELFTELDERLRSVDAELARRYPGDSTDRQPVHTVYVPADQYHDRLSLEWGARAREALAAHAGTPEKFAAVTGLPAGLVTEVYPRVLTKLDREPIEDLRLDFEDGYGNRSDDEEDATATKAARALAAAAEANAAPPFCGLRVKSLEAATRRRGVRTLDLFLDTLLSSGPLPAGFVITFPKVSSPVQVEAMVLVCSRLESAYGLADRTLRFELQIETPQAICGPTGVATVAGMLDAAAGRCSGLHYGTYDYSAACGVAAPYQSMEHPVADHAKAVMQVAAAQTGVHLSDGSTNVLPVGDGDAVHEAWRLHARLVNRSLERAFYQGWDMHPAQLPSRYAATYAFFRANLTDAMTRLRTYAGRGGGAVLDEPATAQGLAGYVLRGLDCGALDTFEVYASTGLDRASLERYARRTNTTPR